MSQIIWGGKKMDNNFYIMNGRGFIASILLLASMYGWALILPVCLSAASNVPLTIHEPNMLYAALVSAFVGTSLFWYMFGQVNTVRPDELRILSAFYKTRQIGTGVITRVSDDTGIPIHEIDKICEALNDNS